MMEKTNLNEQFIKTNEIEERIVENYDILTKERQERKYERELILKLRMHPLSLLKPKDLPDLNIIKSKAHFHQLSENSSKANIHQVLSRALSSCLLPSIMRTDGFRNVMSHSQATPAYFNRMYPYHASNRVKKSVHHSTGSPSHEYGSPFAAQSHVSQPLRNIRYANSNNLENMWNCYRGYSPSHEQTQNESNISIPRRKKKLEIIDPTTGKNILESISIMSPDQSSSPDSVDSTNAVKHTANKDYETPGTKIYCCAVQTDDLKSISVKNIGNGDSNESSVADSHLDHCTTDSNCPLTLSLTSAGDEIKLKAPKYCECHKIENELKTEQLEFDRLQPNSMLKEHDIQCKLDQRFRSTTSTDTEATSPSSDNTENCDTASLKKQIEIDTRLLKDSIYSLKREYQQVSMLKSFLLSKQHQLDETACLLEDKKMEMADLELFLMGKERRLRRKEYLLGTREAMLQNLEKKQEEKEKQLCMMKAFLELNHPEQIKNLQPQAKKDESDSSKSIKVDSYGMNEGTKNASHISSESLPKSSPSESNKILLSDLNEDFPDLDIIDSENALLSMKKQESESSKDTAQHCVDDNPCSKKQVDDKVGNSLHASDNSFSQPTSTGRKYFPLDIQMWLSRKEKILRDKSYICKDPNASSCNKDLEVVEK